jgi:hypothetical protein
LLPRLGPHGEIVYGDADDADDPDEEKGWLPKRST